MDRGTETCLGERGALTATTARGEEALDVLPLPGCLYRAGVVELSYVRHCLRRSYTVQHCHAGRGRAGTPSTGTAGNFHPVGFRSAPGLAQCGGGLFAVYRQPKVRLRPGRHRVPEAAPSDEPTRGQPQDTGGGCVPRPAHDSQANCLNPTHRLADRSIGVAGVKIVKSER